MVIGKEVYPSERLSILWNRKFYLCRQCNAWVGTHKKTGFPLGTLAKKKLRTMRSKLHSKFDPLWRGGLAMMSRGEAYAKLSTALGRQAHIGEMDEEECKRAFFLISDIVKSSFKQRREGNGKKQNQ